LNFLLEFEHDSGHESNAPVLFVPAESDDTRNSQRCKGEIDNTCIQRFARLLSHLLRTARTDRALGLRLARSGRKEKHRRKNEDRYYLFHNAKLVNLKNT